MASMPRLAALLVALTATAVAAQGDVDGRVRAMLSGVEDGPSAAALAQLGEEGLVALVRLVDDPDAPGWLRIRAVQAAPAFAPRYREAVWTLLTAVVSRSPSDLMIRAALGALHRVDGERSRPILLRHRTHPSSAVREAVARLLHPAAPSPGAVTP
jgi:hypothetical protein